MIFKITKYLWDHENYKCSYFQSSKELTKNLKLFLTNNNMQEQVKQLIDYKKDNENQIDFSKKDIKDNEVSENYYFFVYTQFLYHIKIKLLITIFLKGWILWKRSFAANVELD